MHQGQRDMVDITLAEIIPEEITLVSKIVCFHCDTYVSEYVMCM